ncbi:hypothetical protein Pth03_68660 [Planotetraspora thailandica]|uniref:Uncharacterized protein n=1 Tax=Planotetraspora thailandica TaxID=487172 RepID=A0A8J3Y0A7_9ACTN|nr:hypothetical protein [Planotetraspora thailandica]GII58477.1 hypothetical protein Pth03_68660 [Planotetraspora thailandica]
MFLTALILIVFADAYFVFTTLVDVFPFNNVREAKRREKITEVAANAPVMLLPAVLLLIAHAVQVEALAYAGAGLELLIVAGGLALWWLPYLAGVTVPWATAGTGESWAGLHARTYAKTVIVLPARGDRPRPNLEHMILHTLILAAAICAFAAAGTV